MVYSSFFGSLCRRPSASLLSVQLLSMARARGFTSKTSSTQNLQAGLDAKESQKTRILNLEALNNVRDPATIPQFKALTQDKDIEIASRAVNALGHFSGDAVHEFLLDVAVGQKYPKEVRSQAWMSMASRQVSPQLWARFVANYLEYRKTHQDQQSLQPYLNTILTSPMNQVYPESLGILKEVKNLEPWEREMLAR